jgi:hypothetical protein
VKKGGEDAWFVRVTDKGGGEMYVADGVGGFNEQGVDPGLYARVLCFEAAKAQEAMARNPLKGRGLLSLTSKLNLRTLRTHRSRWSSTWAPSGHIHGSIWVVRGTMSA